MKSGFCNDPLTGFLNLFGLMKAVQEDRIGDHGALAILSMNKTVLSQNQLSLEAQLKYFGTALNAYLEQGKVDGSSLMIIPVRIAEDHLVLIFPAIKPQVATEITERLRTDWAQRQAEAGLPSPCFTVRFTGYSKEEKKLTAFLNRLFAQFLPDRPFTGDCVVEVQNLLANLAQHIAESYLLFDRAQNLALSDDVSGLPNHRAAQSVLGEKLNNSLKEQAPFSILFIDGDNLRQYNNISYQKGNSMIRSLGEIIASQLRRGDFLARWFSGDEFLVILPGADRTEALHVGERLRSLVEQTTKSWLFPITISVGMACYPEDGSTLEELLRKAEEANALAKRGGKNQVCEAQTVYVAPGLYQRTNCN